MKVQHFLLLFLCISSLIWPTHRDLDSTFGSGGSGIITAQVTDGFRNVLIDSIFQPDNKLVAVGRSVINQRGHFAITRYSSTGIIDTAFGTSGVATLLIGTGSIATTVVLQPDNKILVGGYAFINGAGQFALARLEASGAVDTAFGNSGIVTTALGQGATIADICLQSDGKIVASGTTIINGIPVIIVIRYDTTGAIDPSFGINGVCTISAGINCAARAIKCLGDDSILIAGFGVPILVEQPVIIKITPNGSLDATFGSNGIAFLSVNSAFAHAQDINVQSDNKIIIAGTANIFGANKILVARFFSHGVVDTTFGSNGDGTVAQLILQSSNGDALSIQANDKINVAGFAIENSLRRVALMQLTAGGLLDATFGQGGIITTFFSLISQAVDVTSSSVTGKTTIVGYSGNHFLLARYINSNSPYILITTPTDGATLTSGTTAISGTTNETGVSVAVTVDGAAFATVTTDIFGNWNAGTSLLLTNGAHSITAQYTLGGTVSATNNFTVAASDSIVITSLANNGTIFINSPQLFGNSSRPNKQVNILVDGLFFASTTTTATGAWISTRPTLSNGTHTITANLIDGAQVATTTITVIVLAERYRGNMLFVDAVFGNNGTGRRNGPPFLTIAGAVAAAQSGDVIFVFPGTYAESVTIPTGVSIIGQSLINVKISRSVVSATDLITMGESSLLENVTLSLSSAQHAAFRGIVFPGTTAATARVRNCLLTVDNSTATIGGSSNVYGVHSTGTGTATVDFTAVQETPIVVKSIGTGVKRGVLVDANNSFNIQECPIVVQSSGGAGSYIGAETNSASAALTIRNGTISGPTADISQTNGTIALAASQLVNANANSLSFITRIVPTSLTWAVAGGLLAGTSYLRPGTDTVNGNEFFIRMAQPAVIKNISLRARVAPGGGNTVDFFVRKNGIDALTISLVDTQTESNNDTQSVSFGTNDTLSVRVISPGVSPTNIEDIVLTVYLY